MAYNKNKYTRKYARKSRVKKIAVGGTSNIRALAKAITAMQKKIKREKQYLQYKLETTSSIVTPYTALNLCAFSSMAPCFGTGANDNTDQDVIMKSLALDMYMALENPINNEENTIQFSMFLVSLKDGIQGQNNPFNPTNGALTLLDDVHYTALQGGLVHLNRKCFKIHKSKRVTFTNYGTDLGTAAAQTQQGTNWRGYWKLRLNNKIVNPSGDWKDLGTAGDPSKQLYLLVFSDNLTADLESPQLLCNQIYNFEKL